MLNLICSVITFDKNTLPLTPIIFSVSFQPPFMIFLSTLCLLTNFCEASSFILSMIVMCAITHIKHNSAMSFCSILEVFSVNICVYLISVLTYTEQHSYAVCCVFMFNLCNFFFPVNICRYLRRLWQCMKYFFVVLHLIQY